MSAHQALMVAAIREGTNLGTVTASSSDTGISQASATASILFNTNGTITFNADSNTSGPTNWDTNGGTYFSYELIQYSVGFDPNFSSANVTYSNTSPLSPSGIYGENRYLINDIIYVSASASALLGEVNSSDSNIEIKVSIWDSATRGSRKAYGTYTASASALVVG